MERLPDELLHMVFGLLSTKELVVVCSRVCRRWACLTERRVLQVKRREDTERVHPGLRALHVCVLSHKLSALLDMAARLTLLTQLTIHAGAPLYTRHITALANLPRLQHLDVFTHLHMLDIGFVPVCCNLTSLVLNETVAPGLLRQLSTHTQLKALHMYGRSLHYPRREMVVLITIRSLHLTELTLRCTELPDSAYRVIGSCGNLTSLQLYSCWLLTSVGSIHVTRPRKLTRLHLSGARLVRHRALYNLLERLPSSIEDLSLSATWFGDDHIQALIKNAPLTRVLELWRCRSLTADGVVRLAAQLPHLHNLDLDVTLSMQHLQILSQHSKLHYIRCIPDHARAVVSRVANTTVVSTHARYPRKYFRIGGEGYRSSLYYYWIQVPLEPLPHYAPPTFDDDDDDDEY